jgi:hypothetical protein
LEEGEVCFRFFGDMSKLPERLRELINEVTEITKDFNKFVFNQKFINPSELSSMSVLPIRLKMKLFAPCNASKRT